MPKLKKMLKVAILTIVSLLFLIVAIIAFAIYFIFTPARLTPVALKVVNESLNARMDMERVELTFFSTFPQFGLKLKDGTLVSESFGGCKADSLLRFGECVVTVNPLDYLRKNQISIHNLSLQDVFVYAFRDEAGRSNWDIMKAHTDSVVVEQEDSTSSFHSEIDIKHVELRNANLVFDDRNTDVYARVDDVNLQLKSSLTEGRSSLSLDFSNKNLVFWQQGELLINKVSSSVFTNILIDRETFTYELRNTALTVNGIRLDADGSFVRDTAEKTISMDVRYGLHAPSVETILGMIPESIMKKSRVKAQGAVLAKGEVKGTYGGKHLPTVSLKVEIKEASAKYAGLSYGIDNFSASFDAYVDLMRTQPSYLSLHLFRFQGVHTDVLANLRIDELLRSPLITFETKTTADLGALAKTFPWQEGVNLGGTLRADLRLQCSLSAVKRQDIGRIKLSGELNLDDILIQDSLKGFDFSSNASFRFSGDNTLQAEAEINRLSLKSKQLSSSMERLSAKVTSSNPQDTIQIVALECHMEMNKWQVNVGETQVGLGLARFDFQAEKKRDSLWLPKGEVEFNELFFSTPEFDLPIHMGQTVVRMDEKNIVLRNAQLQVGHSDILASGSVSNIFGALMRSEMLKARLDIRSNYIDCNQSFSAFSTEPDTIAPVKERVESDIKLFVIPKNIDFELQTHVGKVTFDKMVFEHIDGLIQVKDQAAYLSNLNMRALEADMKAVVMYKATSDQQGFTGFDFNIQDINVGKLVEFIPTLDSIVPMLRSFKGRVDFNVALESQLDSAMHIRIPTLKSAIHIKGDSLVLMDGETFAEIAKMLMFKNKKENIFDSISVNVTVNDGKVTVYPFLIEIDRYKAAVGGSQGLDMNFDYHISILKSPLPFKAGVNVSGNLDKMKYRIGKAKYKDAVSPAEIRKVDSTRVDLGQEITNNFTRLWK